MKKMTVKDFIDKLQNANPDSPINVQIYEANTKQRIEPSTIEITADGLTIHGNVAMVTHESISEYEDIIIEIVAANIKNGGLIRELIDQLSIKG